MNGKIPIIDNDPENRVDASVNKAEQLVAVRGQDMPPASRAIQ